MERKELTHQALIGCYTVMLADVPRKLELRAALTVDRDGFSYWFRVLKRDQDAWVTVLSTQTLGEAIRVFNRTKV